MKIKGLPFKQEGIQMYAATMRVEDLVKIGRVDVWKVDGDRESGYQRQPESARTARVANFLKNSNRPLMPTSVLLSYRGSIPKTATDGVIELDVADEEVLWIVDGQHRAYGFQRAIEELRIERLKDYVLPVVIAEFPTMEDEADQFRIVNETMKKVRTDLARRILALKIASQGHIARREVKDAGRLWEANAVEVVNILNRDADSPWMGKIQLPNSKKQSGQVVRDLSFQTSLKPLLSIWPYQTWPADRIATVLKEYWKAWQSLLPDAFSNPGESVLLKTPGVFSLHQLARYTMEVLRSRGVNDPKIQDFRTILSDLDSYAAEEFWSKDNIEGAAMAGSMKGFSLIADTLEEILAEAGHTIG
jgi:DGQHR domain-containing protein